MSRHVYFFVLVAGLTISGCGASDEGKGRSSVRVKLPAAKPAIAQPGFAAELSAGNRTTKAAESIETSPLTPSNTD